MRIDSYSNFSLQDAFETDGGSLQRIEPNFEIISPDNLVHRQTQQIETVCEVLNVPVSSAKTLLRKYRWSTERIFQDFSSMGREDLLGKWGLSTHENQSQVSQLNDSPENTEFECKLCYDDCPLSETIQINGCGHRFCNNCWTTYIKIKIRDGQSCNIMCMGEKCPMVVDETVVLQCLVDDDEMRHRYSQALIESFVEDNAFVKWCPSTPSCGNAVITNLIATTPLTIKCICEHIFCFACGEMPHQPCTCNMTKSWAKKCADDSETMNWISSNTKDCPGCKKPIEKVREGIVIVVLYFH